MRLPFVGSEKNELGLRAKFAHDELTCVNGLRSQSSVVRPLLEPFRAGSGGPTGSRKRRPIALSGLPSDGTSRCVVRVYANFIACCSNQVEPPSVDVHSVEQLVNHTQLAKFDAFVVSQTFAGSVGDGVIENEPPLLPAIAVPTLWPTCCALHDAPKLFDTIA